jgi:hypothetical protein
MEKMSGKREISPKRDRCINPESKKWRRVQFWLGIKVPSSKDGEFKSAVFGFGVRAISDLVGYFFTESLQVKPNIQTKAQRR